MQPWLHGKMLPKKLKLKIEINGSKAVLNFYFFIGHFVTEARLHFEII
jgi:hypothetical protein